MNGQITFIIWRESIEALLVIGILAGWLARQNAPRRAKTYLWGGVGAGMLLAIALALALLGVAEVLPASARQGVMTAMVFVATGLIVQMVVWMRAHGRTLRRDLETGLSSAAAREHWWAVFILAAIAVAREGSETVVFLYGTIAAAKDTAFGSALLSIAAGFAAALGTFLMMQAGARFLPWRRFFRVAEIMLLLLGCALFVTGVGDLVAEGILPFGASLWDTSFLLDDNSRIGGLVAGLTGYRSAPDIVTVSAWLVYWVAISGILRLQSMRTPDKPRLKSLSGYS